MKPFVGSLLLVVFVAVGVACGDDDRAGDTTDDFPDVVAVVVTPEDEGYRFDVTISSPYDSPARYADAWRVLAPDGSVLGLRELTHDHADEQPFTRSLAGVAIPDGVDEVTVEGRDLANGWGGATMTAALPPATP